MRNSEKQPPITKVAKLKDRRRRMVLTLREALMTQRILPKLLRKRWKRKPKKTEEKEEEEEE